MKGAQRKGGGRMVGDAPVHPRRTHGGSDNYVTYVRLMDGAGAPRVACGVGGVGGADYFRSLPEREGRSFFLAVYSFFCMFLFLSAFMN